MAAARRPKVVTKADETTGSMDIRNVEPVVEEPATQAPRIHIPYEEIPLPKIEQMTTDEKIRAIALRCAVMTDPPASVHKILSTAVRYEYYIKEGKYDG